jgi:hypothetical protein
MSEKASSPSIDQSLAALLRQIRRTQAWRACWMLTTVALCGLLLIMAVDWFLAPVPTWARWSLFGTWLVVVLLTAKHALSPLIQKISSVALARWLELRHPEMQERISTALELQGQERGISAGLLEELRRAAEIDAGKVDARMEVKSVSNVRRWARPALCLLAVFALLLALWPKQSVRLLVRAVAPFSNYGNAGAASFVIAPGNIELLEGDALEIRVQYQGTAPTISLRTKWENGITAEEALASNGDAYLYQLNPVSRSFRYAALAGRDESDWFAVTVWPRPSLVDAKLRVEAPAYLDREPTMEPLDDQVTAVCGTTFHLLAKTNTAIESARLEIAGISVAQANVTSMSGISQIDLPWQLEEPGLVEAKVILRHRLGHDIEAHAFVIELLEDQAPQVVLLSPVQKELRLRPDEQLELRYDVIEDHALSRVAVELSDNRDRNLSLGQDLPYRVEGSRPQRFRGSSTLSIGDLMTRVGNKRDFRIRLKAQDGKPTERSGPGIGYSEWLRIRIDANADSLVRQELREQHEGAMKEIDKTIQQVREARQSIDQQKEPVKKGELPPKTEKNLQEAAEKLADAQEKSNELAKKMEESIHAPLANDVKQAAEKMQQSRENMEEAPLQDESAQREDKMQQASDKAEESIRQLEQVKQEMQKQNEKIQSLARLQELAQKQQEVARQAQQNTEKQNPAEQKEWQEQQKQVAQQLRQELQQQPQALAEALKQQAETAQQLAEQAKDIAQAQEQLQQQAQQSAQDQANKEPSAEETQQAIQQALAKEQAEIAAETQDQLEQAREQRNELADQLPATSAATEKAKEQLASESANDAAAASAEAQQALEKAAAQAEAAAQEKADAAETAANEQSQSQGESAEPSAAAAQEKTASELANAAEALEQLAERQAMVAEAAQALAEGDTGKALEQLQEAQAQSAQELAEAIAAAPQAQPSGAMQQAEQSSKQGSQQAQQAAQQAQQGQQQQAAQQHGQAEQNFAQSAAALEQAAKEMSAAAEQAAQQPTPASQAQASPQDLAQAFSQAAEASQNAAPQQAAQQSQLAAQALQQAAQSAKAKMQGQNPTSPRPGTPQPQTAQQPGEASPQPSTAEGPSEHPPEPDPGLPPELAKLGISAADWEKIQNSLRSDVGSGGAQAIPEEYRELVKGYFQSMSQQATKK